MSKDWELMFYSEAAGAWRQSVSLVRRLVIWEVFERQGSLEEARKKTTKISPVQAEI